jgi:hypothetical protein
LKIKNLFHYDNKIAGALLYITQRFLGYMIEAQMNNFIQLYSIKLSVPLYLNAKKRFQNSPRVVILHGDNGTILVSLAKELTMPSIFWLDGHYSGGFTAKGEKDYELIHFSYVEDAGDLYENQAMTPQNLQANFNCQYGCGIFELRKK